MVKMTTVIGGSLSVLSERINTSSNSAHTVNLAIARMEL
jgi:hypothetical protein